MKKIPWIVGFVFSQALHSLCMNFCGILIQNSKVSQTWSSLKNFYFIVFYPTVMVMAFPYYVKLVHIILGKPKEEVKADDMKKND